MLKKPPHIILTYTNITFTRMKRPVIKRNHFKQPFFYEELLKFAFFHSMRMWWKAPSVLHFLCSHKMRKKHFKARFCIDFFLLFIPRAILSLSLLLFQNAQCAHWFFPASLRGIWKISLVVILFSWLLYKAENVEMLLNQEN